MLKKLNRDQLENQLKRTLADYQNLKKQVEKDRTEFSRFSSSLLLLKLLPVLDDLERVYSHLSNPGLQLAITNFKNVLMSEGVIEIKVLNTSYDPKTAECAELINGKKDLILEVVQKGYTLHGRVLRPSRVKVGKGGPARAEATAGK